MKKLFILLGLLLLFSIIGVSAQTNISSDSTKYYYNGTYNIYDDGVTALSGGTPSLSDSVTLHGWQKEGTGDDTHYKSPAFKRGAGYNIEVSSSVGYGGNSGFRLGAGSLSNSSFVGVVRFWIYSPTSMYIVSTATAGFTIYDGTDTPVGTLTFQHTGGNVLCIDGSCSVTTAIVKDAWHLVELNFTGTQLLTYYNQVHIDTQTYSAGLGFFRWYTNAGTGKGFYVSDVAMCNGPLCPAYSTPPEPSANFTITATTFYFNDTINSFTATMDGVNYTTSNGTLYTPYYQNHTTTENIILYAENHDTLTYTGYNVSSDLAATLNYSYYRYNISVNNSDDQVVNNFTINAYSTNGGLNFTKSTTTGTATFNLSKGYQYNITVDAFGYSYAYTTVTATSWWAKSTVIVYPNNAITIYVRDEDTDALIASNTSIAFNSNASSFTRYTSNGTYFIKDLAPGSWDLTFNVIDTTLGYSARVYSVTVGNRSYQNLNAYLAKGTQTTIFTIRDSTNSELLTGVSTTMYRLVNSTYIPVETKETDITGRVQFTYVPLAQYRFYFSYDGYEELIFNLNPVLFSSYDVTMIPLASADTSQDYANLRIVWGPKRFIDNVPGNFTFLIQSPSGILESYGFNITYPGGNTSASGSEAIGSSLTAVYNVTGATNFDRAYLTYWYTDTIGGYKEFSAYISIDANASAYTLAAQDVDDGLNTIDKIFIYTFIMVICVGVPSLIGRTDLGLLLGMGISISLSITSFIPWWFSGVIAVFSILALAAGGRA